MGRRKASAGRRKRRGAESMLAGLFREESLAGERAEEFIWAK